ncbi:zinc ribbon domain-containing protein [Thermodesulfitimonas sp.]
MFCATKVYNGLLGHLGIMVCDDVDERNTSITCHACGKIRASNRRQRSLYTCSCGWRAQADMNGALNIFKRAYQVSPVKGSSGRVARPAAVSFLLGWHGVVEPKREGKPLRASAWGCPLIY